jgi:hypothetical protein
MKVDTQLLLIAGGAAAILLAVVWRYVARRRQVSRLSRRLQSANDPADRARAGNTIIELGLPRAAKPTLRAMTQEPDDRVRLSIALGVARRQWEPAHAKRVVHLRGWASEELDFQGHPVHEFGPAITRLADMGGPRAEWQGNANAAKPDGNGASSPAQPAEAPVTTLDRAPNPPTNGTGNGNGNGANRQGVAAPNDAYRLAEPDALKPAPPSDGSIRWTAPELGDRSDT